MGWDFGSTVVRLVGRIVGLVPVEAFSEEDFDETSVGRLSLAEARLLAAKHRFVLDLPGL